MALRFNSTAFLSLLLVILLPNGGDCSIFDFAFGSSKRSKALFKVNQQALVKDNQHSWISVQHSTGRVRNNKDLSVDVANAKLGIQNNEDCHLEFHGGSLKLSDSKFTFVSGNDNDLDITECQDFRISGQQNEGTIWDSQDITILGKDNDFDVARCKIFSISGHQNRGTFWDSQHVTFVGNDNNFDVVKCQHFAFSGERNRGTCKNSKLWSSNGNDNKLRVDNCIHIDVKASSNKMTIFAKDSQHVSIQNSSNSQVKMSRVNSVQVSGQDVTLEGTDIKHHAFLGKSCSGNNITHKLTFLSADTAEECGFFSKLRSKFKFVTKIINGVTAHPSSSPCGKDYWPISLEFCNAAIVSGPSYKIGGLPSLSLTIEVEEKTAVIKMAEGNADCKLVSEDGEMKVSISASSEELLIEGAKDIRRVDNGNCEFTLNLGKDAAQVSPSDSAWDGVTHEDNKSVKEL